MGVRINIGGYRNQTPRIRRGKDIPYKPKQAVFLIIHSTSKRADKPVNKTTNINLTIKAKRKIITRNSQFCKADMDIF